ncbi:hypothetical protein [uncultured Nostoc sp.]|uniref:hypothetical protein n=1 Tax=uncultured Nostoc sp. TaxID=340711 RepID=UPI00263217C5|nr:hypothetical protein [uncultured Nostoc sp.]
MVKNPPPGASKKSVRPTIMLSGVFGNIVQSMTFAIAVRASVSKGEGLRFAYRLRKGRVRHRVTIRHNKLN